MLEEVICANTILRSHTVVIGDMLDLSKSWISINFHQRSKRILRCSSLKSNSSNLRLFSNHCPRCSPKIHTVDTLMSSHLSIKTISMVVILLISNRLQSKSLRYFIKRKKSGSKERKKLTRKCKNRWAMKWESLDSQMISTCMRVWV